MPLTIRDTESAFLTARATVEEWKAQFMAEYLQPDTDLMLITMWMQLTPDLKAQLQLRNPEAFKQVESQVKEAIERSRNNGR